MRAELSRVAGRDVSRETYEKVGLYVDRLLEANEQQNLIGRSTAEHVWDRHILDSAQLVRFVSDFAASWLDIGSGAGLPGIVAALLTDGPVTLVEPRRLRAEFLQSCVDELELGLRVTVCQLKVERVSGSFDIITARAVAPIETLFSLAGNLSHPGTVWVLPKGRTGPKELADAKRSWQGRFRTEPSLTDRDAVIVLASDVKPRGGE